MEAIKNWLIAVTCTAMIIAVADSITPGGTIKRIGKLTGGVVLVIVLLTPVIGLDYSALSIALAESRMASGGYSAQEAGNLSAQLMKTIIAEQTGAYILDKATNLGAHCEVEVFCSLTDDNIPYPSSVVISGTLNKGQQEELSRAIEAELAIPREMQTFERGDIT